MDFPFPTHPSVVYRLGFDKGGTFTPFTVGKGETRGIEGRAGDYLSARRTSPRDFHVGNVAKELQARGYRVFFKYEPVSDPGAHEREWRKQAINEGFPLVEDKDSGLAEYDRHTVNGEVELEKIKAFVDKILS